MEADTGMGHTEMTMLRMIYWLGSNRWLCPLR